VSGKYAAYIKLPSFTSPTFFFFLLLLLPIEALNGFRTRLIKEGERGASEREERAAKGRWEWEEEEGW